MLGPEGRARETALEIPANDLNKDDGMETLLAKLDAVFLREEKDRAYEAYSHFDSISKDGAVSMTDYIIDFEQRYNCMKKYNMTLPDAVLAFKLLDTACLEEKRRQLALTVCTDLTFASMKSALKRIFRRKNQWSKRRKRDSRCGVFHGAEATGQIQTEQRPVTEQTAAATARYKPTRQIWYANKMRHLSEHVPLGQKLSSLEK